MGDIKRKRKLFVRPRKIYDTKRIGEENLIQEKYGLKNKREIWKADTKVSMIRKRAKLLISGSEEEKQAFFNKLSNLGLNTQNIEDVLALTKENWLERRLQTFVFNKGLAKTPKQARQFIVHKNILVDGKIVNSPSFIVKKDLENKISLKNKTKKEIKND
jgi:small subunit ribosomal protein S4